MKFELPRDLRILLQDLRCLVGIVAQSPDHLVFLESQPHTNLDIVALAPWALVVTGGCIVPEPSPLCRDLTNQGCGSSEWMEGQRELTKGKSEIVTPLH